VSASRRACAQVGGVRSTPMAEEKGPAACVTPLWREALAEVRRPPRSRSMGAIAPTPVFVVRSRASKNMQRAHTAPTIRPSATSSSLRIAAMQEMREIDVAGRVASAVADDRAQWAQGLVAKALRLAHSPIPRAQDASINVDAERMALHQAGGHPITVDDHSERTAPRQGGDAASTSSGLPMRSTRPLRPPLTAASSLSESCSAHCAPPAPRLLNQRQVARFRGGQLSECHTVAQTRAMGHSLPRQARLVHKPPSAAPTGPHAGSANASIPQSSSPPASMLGLVPRMQPCMQPPRATGDAPAALAWHVAQQEVDACGVFAWGSEPPCSDVEHGSFASAGQGHPCCPSLGARQRTSPTVVQQCLALSTRQQSPSLAHAPLLCSLVLKCLIVQQMRQGACALDLEN